LKVLHELGLDLCVDLPDECADDLHALRERGLRPLKPRDSRPAP
jgi:hypothetical protein